MLSQSVEYALRAMVYLAAETPASCTTAELAKVTQVPGAYLSKIVQGLARSGLVKSQRGAGGGVTLVGSPEAITILDVVNAVEPLQRIRTCPLDLKSHGTQLCPLHRRLDNALAEVEAAFGKTTLAEVLADPNQSKPLCDGQEQVVTIR